MNFLELNRSKMDHNKRGQLVMEALHCKLKVKRRRIVLIVLI